MWPKGDSFFTAMIKGADEGDVLGATTESAPLFSSTSAQVTSEEDESAGIGEQENPCDFCVGQRVRITSAPEEKLAIGTVVSAPYELVGVSGIAMDSKFRTSSTGRTQPYEVYP
jgi:hypothetical protein